MNYKKFKNDEAIGKVAEGHIIRIFNGRGFKAAPVSDINRAFWDLNVEVPSSWRWSRSSFTIEVKHDVYQAKSGNLAVEVWNTNKNQPSGVKSSKADLWAYVLFDSIWLCRRADLLNYLIIPPDKIIKNAGDGNASIYLYKSKDILGAIFHRIDKLTKKEFLEKVRTLCQTKY